MRGKILIAAALLCCLTLAMALAAGGCGKSKAKPELTSMAPSTGEAGQEVTLNGKDFGSSQGDSRLSFGDKQPEVKSWSDTAIVFKVPSDLKEGEYEVKVKTSAGESNALMFKLTVEPAPKKVPKINTIQPAVGASGAQVTIYGSNFGTARGNSKVHLGPVQFEVVSWSDSKLTVKVPPSMGAGDYKVSVETSEGTSNEMDFKVTASEDPEQARQLAIHDYLVAEGINPGDWVYKQSKKSASDPTWYLYLYQRFEGMAHTQFLLHEVSGKWIVVASGEDDFNPQAHGAPADLKF